MFWKAEILGISNRHEEAAMLHRRIIELDPNDSRSLTVLGTTTIVE